MAVWKNRDSQKVACFAYDKTTGEPETGDANNITAQISKDGAATAATNDVNPTELDATDAKGIYLFDLTQAESNADLIVISPVSSTTNILIEPLIIYTMPGTVKFMYEDAVTYSAVNDVGAGVGSFITDLTEASNDHYNEAVIVFVSGNLIGQSRTVSDYDGGTKTISVSTNFTEAPADGDEFLILGRVE